MKLTQRFLRSAMARLALAALCLAYAVPAHATTIFDGTLDGICVVDEKTLRYVTSNLAFSNMIGYSPEELTHLDATDFHPKRICRMSANSFQGVFGVRFNSPQIYL